jgi:hypothetical protein
LGLALKIIGQDRGPERQAADELASEFSQHLRQEDDLLIVVGAKCYGQVRQDIDLILFADFHPMLEVQRESVGAEHQERVVSLDSFILSIEVKDHRPDDIRIVGNQVEVRYGGNWSNATHAAFQQRFSIKNFLTSHDRQAPFILSAIWLRNADGHALPTIPSDILVGHPSWKDVCSLVATLSRGLPRNSDGLNTERIISCGSSEAFASAKAGASLFVRELHPTEIDRRKLERICERQSRDAGYLKLLGQQLLIFKGRGGSGKTIRMLQLAKYMHDNSGERVLLLTYNKALAADLNRLLALIGVRDKVDGPAIRVSSSDAYFWSLLKSFDLAPKTIEDGPFPAQEYAAKKSELLSLLRSASPEEIRADPTAHRYPDVFYWDCVCIDEGQDWPDDERDLLVALFGIRKLVVADGVDQMVRQSNRCEWAAIAAKKRQIVTLRRSMRLKSNLCRFVTTLSEELGIPWELDVNEDIRGGGITVLRGEYGKSVHETAYAEHQRLGNMPIDYMFCVTGAGGSESAQIGERLVSAGYRIWDGTKPQVRNSFPTDAQQFRIVNYESARGLEGWTVVCLDLDLFFERQLKTGQLLKSSALEGQDEIAHVFASQWALIPVTRAVDTLILQISGRGQLAEAIMATARFHTDFVQIVM